MNVWNWVAALVLAVVGIFVVTSTMFKNAVNDSLRFGTVAGFERCLQLNTSEVVSERSIALSCAEKIGRSIPYDVVDGFARFPQFDKENLDITLKNRSTEYVGLIARIRVSLVVNEKVTESLHSTHLVGLEPLSSDSFTTDLDGDEGNLEKYEFCRNNQTSKCITWYVDVIGVSVR